MMLSSAYSLAALNQTYYFDLEWYSQYNNSFENLERNDQNDKWNLSNLPKDMKFIVASDKSQIKEIQEYPISDELFNEYEVIYVGFESIFSYEYRVKILEAAQRGNNLEIKLSLNSPTEDTIIDDDLIQNYKMYDIVRIKKDKIPQNGKTNVVFKDQNGNKLYSTDIVF